MLFSDISEPIQGAQLTNADRLRREPWLSELPNKVALIEAATHKYPEEHDYRKCKEFALALLA